MINNNTHSELEEKVQSLESVLKSFNEGYWEWDILTNKVIFNHTWYTLLSYEPYELPQSFETFETLLYPDDKEKTLKILNSCINQNVTDDYELDFRMIKKSGEICWILSHGNIKRDDEGKPSKLVGTHIDITDYKLSEERVKYLNSILLAIRDINQLIVTEKDENILLTKSCEILSETRGFNLVWIGEIEKNNYKVISKAFSGSYAAFSDLIGVTWDDSPIGLGPTGKAIKTIKTCIVNNIRNDPHFEPWMDAINKHGFNSAVALPLTDNGEVFGNLTIYSTSHNAFDNEEISLLEEVTADISFAVHALKLEEERKKVEKEKQELIEELQLFTEELQVSNEELQVTTEELQVSNEELQVTTEELQVSNERLKHQGNEIRKLADVVKSSDDAIMTKSLDGIITSWNKGAENTYGYSAEEILGESILLLEPPQLNRETEKLIEKVKLGEKINHYETLRLKKDGTLINVSVTLSPVFDTSKKLVAISTITRDITERKLAEEQKQKLLEKLQQFAEKLKVSNEELQATTEELLAANKEIVLASSYNRSLIEASMDPLVTIGHDGKITDVNLATEFVTGHSRDELIGTDFSDYFTEPEKARKGYQQVFYEGFVRDYPLEIQHKNGDITPVLYNASVYRDKNNEVVGVFAAARDITELKKAEKELELASNYNRSLIEASIDPLVTIGPDGKITDVNYSTEMVTGYSRDDIVDTDFSDYFTEPEKAREGYKEVFREGWVFDYPLEIKHKDGQVTPVLYNASVYKNEDGEVIGVFAAARDITEVKRAENKVKASLKEKEVLLKEIHHRVKNNLQIISSLIDLQLNYVDEDETVTVLQDSRNRVKSMAMIHEKLYQSNDLASIEFSSYIQKLIRDLFYSYGAKGYIKHVINVEHIILNIETAIPCGLIISELVSNSLKYAFPDDIMGEISISFSSEDDEFELIIGDDGIGLPEDLDFKNVQSSLGLRLVNMLVNQLDGSIELDRTNGTKFKMKFKELQYKKRF